MRRLSNTKLNAITLYLNFIVLAVIGLVSNPLLVRFLGVEAFGIWKACLRLLDLTSVADGRASQALKWIVAHKSLRESEDHMRREVGSAIAVWMLWLPILMTVISVMLWLLPHLIKDIPPADLTAARMAAGLLGANILLTGVMGVPDSVLAGTNQGFRSYIVMTTLLVFSNVAMVLAAWLGYGIIGLGAATVAGSFLTGLCTLLVAYRYVSWWGVKRPTWQDVKRVLSFSNWTQVWSLVQMLMLSTDILLISYLVGPVLVGKYTFTYYVTQFAISICLMTGSAITPRLGALVGAGQLDEAAAVYNRTREAVQSIALAAACGLVLCNGIFVGRWVGTSFYVGDMGNLGMVLVMLQLVILRFDAQIQDVGLQIRNKVIAGSLGAVLALALGALAYHLTSNLLVMFLGIFIGRLPLNVLFPRQVRRLIPTVRADYTGLLGIAVTVAAAFALSMVWRPTGIPGLVLTVVVSLLLSGSGALAFIVSGATRNALFARLMGSLNQREGRLPQ